MFKKLFAVLAAGAVLPLAAFYPGETAADLNAVWLQGRPVSLVPDENEAAPVPYVAVTFVLTRTANTPPAMTLLESLKRRFAGKVTFAVISADTQADCQTLLKESGCTLNFGRDRDGKLSAASVGNSRLMPFSLLIDRKKQILWCGETPDLPEAISDLLNGKNNVKKNLATSRAIEEMQLYLRENKPGTLESVALRTLEKYPGHSATLRMLLFVWENQYRFREAMDLLKQQLQLVPEKTQLFFIALELTYRHAELAGERIGLVRSFAVGHHTASELNLIAWSLLQLFPEEPQELQSARELYLRAKTGREILPEEDRCRIDATGALLACRLGDSAEACRMEKPLEKIWRELGNTAQAEASRRRLAYYQMVRKLSNQK